ncbi:hypothetical protein LEADMM068B1_02995 [Leclercia adecarboxylata]|uniref:hypothetical protein n=1 Tax=Leclercia adecarboxylata TaxID=83655 RepID=UPI0012BB2849|nr:hypothetical protein [Leclercia adecarboxylata]QGP84409.1 hypothetical protein GLX29_14320 [Leclercia adecarboxylata]
MTNKQSHWHLASKAKASKFVLEQISSFEADEIDSDDVELRFEIDGRDTGTNVSIVDECAQAAAVIDGLLDELEAKDKLIAELESERNKQGLHACELFDEVTAQRQRIAELVAAGILIRINGEG